jgi:hypothetical protein
LTHYDRGKTYKALSEITIEAVHIVYEPDELVTYIVEVVDYILGGRSRRCESRNEERGNGSELDDELHIRG